MAKSFITQKFLVIIVFASLSSEESDLALLFLFLATIICLLNHCVLINIKKPLPHLYIFVSWKWSCENTQRQSRSSSKHERKERESILSKEVIILILLFLQILSFRRHLYPREKNSGICSCGLVWLLERLFFFFKLLCRIVWITLSSFCKGCS